MDLIAHMVGTMFRDQASMLLALLVFLAAGTVAFAVMALVRVRGAVKRRTAAHRGRRATAASRRARCAIPASRR